MSDAAAEYTTRLNLAEVVTRIERQQAETRKFVAERDKLFAEQTKLAAEAAKLNRDRFLAPAVALAATLGAIAAIAPAILRAVGG